MMGVYIKGMEMPTSCTECWFRKTARHEYLSDCQICPFTGDTTPYTKRKDDCPLVPVPPHGRLIDADALLTDTTNLHVDVLADWVYVRISTIEDATTIIPGEEGET